MRRKRFLTPDPQAPDAARRQLLTGGALTVAASASLLAGRGSAEPADQEVPADPKQPSYRVTDHIAAYYRRARQ